MINNLIQKWNLKTTIIFGLIGFFISLFIVIIKGADFIEMIFRPLVSGIIMAIFWNLSYFLVKKFVPDFVNDMENTFVKPTSGESPKAESSGMYDDSGEFNFDLDKTDDDFNGSENNKGNRNGVGQYNDQKSAISDNAQNNGSRENSADDVDINHPTSAELKPKKRKINIGSDEMLVEGIPIKKDPELMARTIQHVLDTDKE